MPAYVPRRGRSFGATLFFGVVLLIIGAAGVLGTLYALGVELPFLSKPAEAIAGPNREGQIPVLVAARPIPANTRVTRDDIFDAKTQSFTVQWLRPQDIRPEMIRDFNLILGRVTKTDKRAGYVFTEKEFHPIGTTPGITAAIPPGKRSFVFEAEKVRGIQSLRPGDHFDVVASQSFDPKNANRTGVIGQFGTPTASLVKKANVRPVVQNGVVLTAVQTRQVPYSSSGLTTGTQYKTRPVQEITIAIDPDEVGILSEAMAVEALLTCVARSGQPMAAPEPAMTATPSTPEQKITFIETIVNGQRQVHSFAEPPTSREEPAAPAPPELAPFPRPAKAGRTL